MQSNESRNEYKRLQNLNGSCGVVDEELAVYRQNLKKMSHFWLGESDGITANTTGERLTAIE
jgi:hypothetical protein